ncbi:MAG: helix-hairpin-helix domain-containing protein [Acidimicrobiia bacterium]|nr:helix-hairpin-helix domain-containing protein [Acidimicrobiia bacterium]
MLVDLNEAGAAELESLPGIGPVTAAAIISHRQREGPFRSVESLQGVVGIGPVKLSRIEDLVTVTP